MKKSVLGMILAGGEGRKLRPLTKHRAKPAIPFGGKFRIIDFVLSNFINSGITSTFVLTQYKSQSLTEHIINGWNISGAHGKGRFIIPIPAQMQTAKRAWYRGTADAIYQNLHFIEDFSPDLVAIFVADHIYHMDISQMIQKHIDKNAMVTVSAIPVSLEDASKHIVIQADEEGKITGFQAKPKDPTPMPSNPQKALISMGNYIFNGPELISLLKKDIATKEKYHSFGKCIIPSIIDTGRLFAYNFHLNKIPGRNTIPAWRDIEDLKSYYYANLDLRNPVPELDLYNQKWPIYNYHSCLPPAKFVHNHDVGNKGFPRIGKAINSLVCDGCIVSGSAILDSVLFNSVHVHSYSTIKNSILLNGVEVMESCKIKNVIIDKDVKIPKGTSIGYDRKEDEKRFHVIELEKSQNTWLSVVPKKRAVKMTLPNLYGPDFNSF